MQELEFGITRKQFGLHPREVGPRSSLPTRSCSYVRFLNYFWYCEWGEASYYCDSGEGFLSGLDLRKKVCSIQFIPQQSDLAMTGGQVLSRRGFRLVNHSSVVSKNWGTSSSIRVGTEGIRISVPSPSPPPVPSSNKRAVFPSPCAWPELESNWPFSKGFRLCTLDGLTAELPNTSVELWTVALISAATGTETGSC